MKNLLLFALLTFGVIFSMEQPSLPQRGQKRWRQQLIRPFPKSRVASARTAFELLPPEIKTHILSFLTTARGATQRARLDNAAENIRSFFAVNTQFKPLGDDPQIIEYLITELANRYANGDKVAAAIALGTETAGKWLVKALAFHGSQREAEREKLAQKVLDHFVDAAKDGRINVIKFMLKFIPNSGYNWQKALASAVKNNHVEIVRLILSEPTISHMIPAMVNNKDSGGVTVLSYAIKNSNEQIVDILMASGANVNLKDNFDFSPIHIAARQNNLSIVRKIIAAIFPQHFIDSQAYRSQTHAQTALMIAIERGNLEIVELLLNAGADINRVVYYNHDRKTPLSFAEHSHSKNKDTIIKLLKERGAE